MTRALAKPIRSCGLEGWKASLAAAVAWGDPAATRLLGRQARQQIIAEQSGRWCRGAERLLVALTQGKKWRVLSFREVALVSDHAVGLCLLPGLRHAAGVSIHYDVGAVLVNVDAIASRYLIAGPADVGALAELLAVDVARTALHECAHALAPPDRLERLADITPELFRRSMAAPCNHPPGSSRPGHAAEWVRAYSLLTARCCTPRGMDAAPWREWENTDGWRRLFWQSMEADLEAHAGRPGAALYDAAISDYAGRGPWHAHVDDLLSARLPPALVNLFEAEHSSAAA